MKRSENSPMQANTSIEERASTNDLDSVSVRIYVAPHCANCEYSYKVAGVIQRDFPEVNLRIINMSEPEEEVPEVVFATPTYLLNGKVWSLGNPSMEQVQETLSQHFSICQPFVG